MSQQALGAALDRLEIQANPESTLAESDRIELTVRRLSRLAGYLSLAAAVVVIAYLVIR
ncbi:MAG TPA: hypothetical protein VN137_10360 [Sphingomonas sp.]|nr:hypothetical protein [Sphingomonas sp.]